VDAGPLAVLECWKKSILEGELSIIMVIPVLKSLGSIWPWRRNEEGRKEEERGDEGTTEEAMKVKEVEGEMRRRERRGVVMAMSIGLTG